MTELTTTNGNGPGSGSAPRILADEELVILPNEHRFGVPATVKRSGKGHATEAAVAGLPLMAERPVPG
ncbi:hypothetical protein GCM10010517_61060 [Streptosporangium fragile]|uniref:Uncharacterized protein n=1 Tax=Streptosporangium fragile TaxID=46186 RepID=A0ABP6IMX8_9ACTN